MVVYIYTFDYLELQCVHNKTNPVSPKKNYTPPHPWDLQSEHGNGGYIGYIFPLPLSTIW